MTTPKLLARMLAVFVALCWLATEITPFAHSRPFLSLWTFPPPTTDCATLKRSQMAEGSLNLASEVAMLCVVKPVVFQVNMPWRHEITLFGVPSAGIFVIFAVILTNYFDLTPIGTRLISFGTSAKPASPSCVANMSVIWPHLLQRCPCLLRVARKPPRGSDEPVVITFGAGGGRGAVDDSGLGTIVEDPNPPEMRQRDTEAEIGIITAPLDAAEGLSVSSQSSNAGQSTPASPWAP
ncbi:hypothetical protein MCOR25_003026 [Pyricularia grisea]|nr:hypothetical protein MCOR25_003026 [Pyricularia grisea]